MRYVGFCYDSKAWGGDLTGLLLVESRDGGWLQTASHISSSEGWSHIDIGKHYERRDDPTPADTFEWVGLLNIDEAMTRFPAANDEGSGE